MEVPKGAEVRTELGRLAFDVRRGISGAEDRLVRRLSEPLRIMCRMRRIALDDAEDLVQESLVTLIRQLRSDEPISYDAVGAYARSAVLFILTGQQRREARRAELLDPIAEDIAPASPTGPEQTLDQAQLAEAVQGAIDSLPQERDRVLMREHYVNERDKDGLCSELGLTARQFDRVIFNARRRLQQVLKKRGWGDSSGH